MMTTLPPVVENVNRGFAAESGSCPPDPVPQSPCITIPPVAMVLLASVMRPDRTLLPPALWMFWIVAAALVLRMAMLPESR